MRFSAAVCLLALLLMGCASSTMIAKDPGNPYYLPPAGSKIQLNQPITVPSGATRIFIQRGQLVEKMTFDRYVPSCNFEVSTLTDRPQIIDPETFLVVRVQQEMSEVVQLESPVQVASLNLARIFDSGLPMVTHSVHLWIGSDLQPNLRRLTCRGAFDDMPKAYPPSIAEMRAALGKIAEIILP